MDGALGFGGTLKTRKIRDPRARRVFRARMGKLGQIAYTRDPGEAEMFSMQTFRTRLMAHIYDAQGRHISAHDLGSGAVTSQGVLAMANDFRYAQVSGSPVNTLGACKYHAWGIGTTAANRHDFELETYSKPTAATENATAGVNSLNYEKAGKNQKMRSIATITAAENLAITEWGLHSHEKIKEGLKTAAASGQTTTLLKGEAAAFTASTATVRGEQNRFVWVEETNAANTPAIGLVFESTTTELLVPGFIKAKISGSNVTEEAEAAAAPKASTKYRVIPTLWDRKQFSALNLENTNKIEFIYELEIVAGG